MITEARKEPVLIESIVQDLITKVYKDLVSDCNEGSFRRDLFPFNETKKEML